FVNPPYFSASFVLNLQGLILPPFLDKLWRRSLSSRGGLVAGMRSKPEP
ncbi:MAG: hypothetical protein ACI8VR_002783, partial [Candidatus Azotimanducaceae bacterium]